MVKILAMDPCSDEGITIKSRYLHETDRTFSVPTPDIAEERHSFFSCPDNLLPCADRCGCDPYICVEEGQLRFRVPLWNVKFYIH